MPGRGVFQDAIGKLVKQVGSFRRLLLIENRMLGVENRLQDMGLQVHIPTQELVLVHMLVVLDALRGRHVGKPAKKLIV